MRRRAINEVRNSHLRITATASRDLDRLAELLNAADKPPGYPMQDVSRAHHPAEPRTAPKGHALDLAVALVLDQLESGALIPYDLLLRSADLAEVNPEKAEMKRALKDEE